MVEATVLVRKLRRLQPASCADDVIVVDAFSGAMKFGILADRIAAAHETKERRHAFGSSYRDINSA
jgi:hypothetical protein